MLQLEMIKLWDGLEQNNQFHTNNKKLLLNIPNNFKKLLFLDSIFEITESVKEIALTQPKSRGNEEEYNDFKTRQKINQNILKYYNRLKSYRNIYKQFISPTPTT